MNHEQKERRMELLAPAGSFEAFKAAVENGADAVYLGGKSFNARASAANFDIESLRAVVRYAHDRQVKIYVTVNILVADREFPELIDYLYELYSIGVDAIILQDMGASELIRTVLPELERHASTQMTVNSSWGVRHLEKTGFQRVVLARETSAAEMRTIAEHTPLELEVFIHGALCICYSGQCLMSSFIGGRSGNRGTCAQPCRMTYQLVNKEKRDMLAGANVGEHLLSPRDLNLVEQLGELWETGVASLKIEGRMKRPEYVATVVRIYRQALDRLYANEGTQNTKLKGQLISDAERQELTQIFNRDFTQAYFEEQPGAELMSYSRPNNRGIRLGRVVKSEKGRLLMKLEVSLTPADGLEIWTGRGREGLTVERLWNLQGNPVPEGKAGETVQVEFNGLARPGDRIFKTHDAVLMEKARLSFQEGKEQRKRPLMMLLTGRTGEKLKLVVRDGEREVTVYSANEAEEAAKRPLTADYVLQQLGRLGTTPFWLDGLDLDLKGEIMIPVRDLNDMRRRAVEELLIEAERSQVSRSAYQKRVQVWQAELNEFRQNLSRAKVWDSKLTVAVSDLACLRAAAPAGAHRILLGGELWRSRRSFSGEDIRTGLDLCQKKGIEGVWRLPRIFNEAQSEKLLRELEQAARWDERPVVMVGNLGTLELVRSLDPDWPLEIDYTLNVFNEASLAYYLGLGAGMVTISPELNEDQIRTLAKWPGAEMLVFGDMEMMVSEYCPVGATLGGKKGERCSRPCVEAPYFLQDRLRYNFPIETDKECRMHLFNVKLLNLYEELDSIAGMGIRSIRLQLLRETPEQVGKIVSVFAEGWPRASVQEKKARNNVDHGAELLTSMFRDGFTKGHFFRGVL